MAGMRKNWVYRRGDVYLANLNPFKGSEQGGKRPVVVIQNNDGNFYSTNLIVSTMSSRLKKLYLPTHVLLEKGYGLRVDTIAELEQIHTISKVRILRYIGKIPLERMPDVDIAALKSLGMNYLVPYVKDSKHYTENKDRKKKRAG